VIAAARLGPVQTITLGVLAFFALLALVTIVRVVMRRERNAWDGLRVGFFVERVRDSPPPDDDSPGEV